MKQDSRRGAVEMGTILMVVAFAVIVGFIVWLRGQAETERSLEVREDTTAQMGDDSNDDAAIPIVASDIMMDASGYAGQRVRLAPQTVASLVGQQGFFVDFPTGPFFVSLSDDLRAQDLGIASQDVVRATGTITAMSDSVAAAWQAAGTISEDEAFVLTVSSYYLAADAVQVSGPAADGASN